MSTTDPYAWILSDDQLAQASVLWNSAAALAIDTEFVRTETFHANLGLIQVCLDDTTWLIDPLTISNWKPFAEVLVNPDVVKVLHSLSEDAEVLNHACGAIMQNVFDTQIAAGFLGYPVQMSYAKLVDELFDQNLPKEATRSDWMKRPLDSEQCRYAAADVHWLYQVYNIFADKLKAAGRYDWIKEDSSRMVENNLPVAPEAYYLKLRGGWKLKGSRLQALKDLCAWREQLARNSNVNRGRILPDKDLITIAEKMPSSKSILQKVMNVPSRKIRLYGDQIIHMVVQAQETRKQDFPDRIEGPLPADQADLLKSIRTKISEISEENGIPSEILARRKLLEIWLRSGVRDGNYNMPTPLNGWRKELLYTKINELLLAQWKEMHET